MYEKNPEHMVHCALARKKMKDWPRPPKPGKRQDGSEWAENSWPMKFHRLELVTTNDRFTYYKWLIQNPEKFGEFCDITQYYEEICPPFEDPRWCCANRREPEPAEPLDEELEELEIVEPGRIREDVH